MKTRPIELIVISGVLFTIIGLAFFTTSTLVPSYKKLFKDYHIFVDITIFLMFFMLFSVFTVRILLKIFPLRPGSFTMLSTRAFYWKLITSITEMGGMFFLPFIPLFLRPLFFGLFGAKIGKNVEIAGKLIELPLITIGEYAFIGGGVYITAHAIVHDRVLLKPVEIARKATIGIGAVIMPGVKVGENSVVAPGAVVTMDTDIPPNEFWGGIPARKIKDNPPSNR
jgi:carbonic anhydrase/acetyltransferase-like protein (isoleucine patch superfamily)